MIKQRKQSAIKLSDKGYSSIVNFTNEVLVYDQTAQKQCLVYYLPAYLRAKLKNIIEMDFEKLMAKVNMDFILDVYYGSLDDKDLDFLRENMVLIFPRDPPLKLSLNQDDGETPKIVTVKKQENNCLRYTIRKIVEVEIINDIALAPFQTARIIISVNLRKIKRQLENSNIWVKYKFNFMDIKGEEFHDLKFSKSKQKNFGFYNIAEKQMRVQYSNEYENPQQKQDVKAMTKMIECYEHSVQKIYSYFKPGQKYYKAGDEESDQLIFKVRDDLKINPTVEVQKPQKEEVKKTESKIDAFQYAYFILPMYKAPYSMTALVMLQLLLIGTVNVCIFYQDTTLSGKQMLNMAALMVSLIGILPNIRESMGRSSQITLAEMCTIIQTFTVILTFIHMIQKVDSTENNFYVLGEESLAIICILITGLIAVVLIGFLIVHEFWGKRQYHYKKEDKKYQVMWFDRKYWKNEDCDAEFRNSKQYKDGRICMLRPN